MKKLLSIILCMAILVGLMPSTLSFNARAALDELTVGETWNGTWDEYTETKYAYLTVNETGFYNLSLEDLRGTSELYFCMYDLDSEEDDYSWHNTYISAYLEDTTTYEENNIYLITGHQYEIKLEYGYYSEYVEEYVPVAANINLCITKSNYETIDLTLGKTENLTVGDSTRDWLEFKTTTAGDYLIELNQTSEFGLNIYKKNSSESSVNYSYHDKKAKERIRLEANTEYIIRADGYEGSSKLLRMRISKAVNNISKLDVVQDSIILANHGYIYGLDDASLLWSHIEGFEYKITYSDRTTETLSYYELESNGIVINYIEYTGGIVPDGNDYLFKSGKQTVTISYMNAQKSSSYINVTSYLDRYSYLNTKSDYDDMWIEYEDEDEDNYNQTYYWHIKPDQTNMYNFYSRDWDNISASFTIFDKNNNIIKYNDSWCLKAGEEYCLRINYSYYDYCYDDVNFWLAPNTNHVHSYKAASTTKATTSKNGKITKKCSVCGNTTSSTIYYPKTIKLATTTYTYNGKVQKPAVTVIGSNGKTISSSNYTVSYESGRKNPGKYKVTITFKGNYSGTKNLYFTIKPKKASLSSVKSTAKKKMTVKWSKQSGVTGYEILYATNSKFTKGKKTVTVKGASSKSKTIKSLKSKKTYYVKVRAYKTIDGKKVYGSYSKTKKVKVK